MTDAFKGGWQIEIEDADNTDSWARIEEVLDIQGAGFSGSFIEVTNDASPPNGKEFIGARKEGNDLTVVVNYVIGAVGQLRARQYANDGINTRARITLTNGTSTEVETFDVALSGWDQGLQLNEANTRQFQMKISGDIAFS